MDTKKIYYEHDDHTGTSIGVEYEKYLYQSQSKYQNIEVIKTKKYGNAMYLDGCFMLAQKNQDYYHDKCINLVPSNSKRILIIGGGDFAIASMLYEQKNVRVIYVVEIDEEVVNVSKKYFSRYFKFKSTDKKKLTLIIQNGEEFIKENQDSFDCIIIDSTDPVDNAKILISKPFLKGCYKTLSKNGCIIQQSGSPLKDMKKIINPLKNKYLEIGFKSIQIYEFPMPLYPTGLWSFITAKKSVT